MDKKKEILDFFKGGGGVADYFALLLKKIK